ncbi:MAG TPA: Fe-S cluster assembly ATPase SufC, partial [Opitutae bacterium]|nr:Fe-S cluster assembly ATPase SufC [Opitutae bacterium]
MNTLEITQLNVSIHGQAILKDFNLIIPKGEVHALMGPNGTGKSTLAKVMAGHEDYTVDSGDIVLDGESILGKEPDEISHAGLFLAFQYPMEIPGVSIANFIRAARAARLEDDKELNAVEFYKELYAKMDALKMDRK